MAPLAVVIRDFDVANFVDVVAVFRRIADDEIELPLALQNLGGYRSAHGRLNDRVDIAGVEAIARGFGTIHFDVQVGLPKYREDAEVGDAAHLVHLVADLLGELASRLRDWGRRS